MTSSLRSRSRHITTSAVLLLSSLACFAACSDDAAAPGPSSDTSQTPPGATGNGGTPGSSPGAAGAAGAASGAVVGSGSAGGEGGSPAGPEPEPQGDPAVQYIGRFETKEYPGPACAWPGCRIIARFEGTGVSARLNEHVADWMKGGPSEWDVLIDDVVGAKLVTTVGDHTYELAKGLPEGKHKVVLWKRSEAQNGVTEFLGFDFHGGKMLAPPARKARRLEVIGDSQPAGFGVEGVGLGPDCPGDDWAARWQNFRKSMAAKLAETFDAEVMGTVYSGKGMAKNIWHPDKDTMPILFARANPVDRFSTWNHASYVPDVVVIMIGGNDFAVGQPYDEGPATLEQFTNAYDEFAVTLRRTYPNAHVFLVVSPSVSDAMPEGRNSRSNVKAGIATVIARRSAAGDARIYPLEPPIAGAAELTACNGHGSPEFHVRLAADLAAPIRAKTGW